MTLADFDEVVYLVFEFNGGTGEPSNPVCLVARTLKSGQLFRVWLEGKGRRNPPFPAGPKVLTVAYYATAELGCYLALGWPVPHWILDLYAEFRAETNGRSLPHGRGLFGAMQWFQLSGIEALRKDAFRKRIMAGAPFSPQEHRQILDYCQSDVDALPQLDRCLLRPGQNLNPALLRGEYMKAVAHAEFVGVPLDLALYQHMQQHWPRLQSKVVAQINQTIPVFEHGHFRMKLFETWLSRQNLLAEWPRTLTGELARDDDTLKQMAELRPQIEPLRQVRQMLDQMRKLNVSVGPDGRNRCLLSPYSTKTGRNAPSTAKWIFGMPSYMRGLIRPEPGRALAYVDWEQQEFGIAAALSGDTVMQEAYSSGDPYLSFAKQAGAIPPNATKQSHPREREQFKTVILGTQYLIGPHSLGCRLNVTLQEAEDLLGLHRSIYRRFWQWSDSVSDYGQLYGEWTAAFGWRLQLSTTTNLRTMRNFPMQANGSEMLRLAAIYTLRAGVSIVTLIHDAILIEADQSAIEHHTALTQQAMEKASQVVLAGFSLRSEARIIHAPDRLIEERGVIMWQWILESLTELGVPCAA
jgi:hypothetical protein